MTTTAVSAVPAYVRRPVPWRRLGWVAWRHHRGPLMATGLLLAVTALYLVITGLQMRTAYAAVLACRPRSAQNCRFAFSTFHDAYAQPGIIDGILLFMPGVIGAFTGAPLLARGFETGTFRYAWTQGVGRTRWLLAHLVPGALGVAAASGILGGLVSWHQQPLVDSGIEQTLHASAFPVTGLAVLGWGLLGYSIGALAGLLTRRTVPALAVTLAAWTGFAFLASGIRPHYQAPLVTSRLQLATTDLPIQQWFSVHGVRASEAQITHALQPLGIQSTNGGGDFQVSPGSSTLDPVQYLLQHGYTQWTSYQPDSRYWTFQTIEFGWLALLSLALLATTVWLTRRRAG